MDYDASNDDHRKLLANTLVAMLLQHGYEEIPIVGINTRERVFRSILADPRIQVFVYTTLVPPDGLPNRHKMPIRVRALYVRPVEIDASELRNIQPNLAHPQGRVCERKTSRTGSIPDIVNRVLGTSRRVWKDAANVTRCPHCGAPMFVSKKKNRVCAGFCWKKKCLGFGRVWLGLCKQLRRPGGPQMSTNANSTKIADLLADANAGTFTGLITTKKGQTRGRGAAKLVYGDDTVHAVIYTGFKYENLVAKSLVALAAITDAEIVSEACRRGIYAWAGKPKTEVPVTEADVALARQELVESFTRTLDPKVESESTTAAVYEPLEVDGKEVRGSRVYKCTAKASCRCRNCTGDAKAPLPGTIYLQGLAIGRKVLIEAANGPVPAAKSSPKTVAKKLLRSKLPVSKYVSYALEPGEPWFLRAGGAAVSAASSDGLDFTEVGELVALCG